MTSNFNIFEVLNIKVAEDPHDRMVAWLCDPNGGHGIPDVASAIVDKLWGESCDGSVLKVVRQFKLSEESWSDIGVVFPSALLLIENKVQASALREGQIELQHSLGRQRMGEKGFFHCVLCPDFLADVIPSPSPSFQKLRYGVLADILDARVSMSSPEATPILEHYIGFVRQSFGARYRPPVKLARADTISRRNAGRAPWAWEQILETAGEHGGSDLQFAHQELLDLLVSMRDVEPRFLSAGGVDATYTVYLSRRQTRFILQVYADGRLYVSWEGLYRENQPDDVEAMRGVWAPYVKGPRNTVGSYTSAILGPMAPVTVASLLQRTADLIQPIEPADAQ